MGTGHSVFTHKCFTKIISHFWSLLTTDQTHLSEVGHGLPIPNPVAISQTDSQCFRRYNALQNHFFCWSAHHHHIGSTQSPRSSSSSSLILSVSLMMIIVLHQTSCVFFQSCFSTWSLLTNICWLKSDQCWHHNNHQRKIVSLTSNSTYVDNHIDRQ